VIVQVTLLFAVIVAGQSTTVDVERAVTEIVAAPLLVACTEAALGRYVAAIV
jgi:hypothetical protein